MTPGQRIKKLRILNKLEQEEVAEQLDHPSSVLLTNWESDKSLPPSRELKKLAKIFEVSVDYILGLDHSIKNKEIKSLSNPMGLAFFESIEAALLAKNTTDNKQQTIVLSPFTLKEKKEHYFVVQIKTNLINSLIPLVDNIIILDFALAEDKSLKSNDIIIVKLEQTYKIVTFRKMDSKIYLEPSFFNADFKSITITPEKFRELEIVGKAIVSYRILYEY